MNARTRKTTAGALGLALAVVLAGCSGDSGGGEGETGGEQGGAAAGELTILIDSQPSSLSLWEGLVAGYNEENPDVEITLETQPGGSEGDNVVKTRLATGEMPDLFWYNSGSLFQALKPTQNLTPITDEDWVSTLDDNMVTVVSAEDEVYGAPVGASFAGAMIYNKTIYSDLGLEVPTTWEEFMANNEAIKAAGKVAVVQTYGDTWTSQVPVLGDFYNVEATEPGWAEAFTANEAKFVDPPALAGFQALQDVFDGGFLNENFASATYDDGVRMLAEDEAAHYPMLTGNVAAAIGENYPDAADTLGVFPIPGASADTNGLTVWMPNALYIPSSTEGAQLDAAKDFLAWIVTPASCEIQAEATTLGGPFVVDGCDLPADVPALVSDMQPYFDAGDTGLALEFLSPVKGPSLEQITVEVGSGIRSAADGAALYDEDVKKQAQQLGLEGW